MSSNKFYIPRPNPVLTRPKSKNPSWPFLIITWFTLALLSTGCGDRSIDPFEGDSGHYSIYGALSVNETPNYIRISDLSMPFLKDSTQMDNVTVTFEDLGGNIHTTLQDTIVEFSGNFTHNFILNEELKLDSRYRLTVQGPEGITASSFATTPLQTDVQIAATDSTVCPDPDAPIFGSEPGEIDRLNEECDEEQVRCRIPIDFTFRNVRHPETVRMEVGFMHNNEIHWSEIGIVDQLAHNVNENEMHVRMSPRDLLIEVFTPPSLFDSYTPDPRRVTPLVLCHELESVIVRGRYRHFGPEWENWQGIHPVTGSNDPLKVQDVEGGLGLFGAFHTGTFSFKVDTTTN